MPTRQELIDALRAALQPRADCRALWLGGSDATGRTDALSDIDIQAIVSDDAIESTFVAAESALAALSPIARRYRVPEPSWHGHSQTFYALRDCPPELMIDFTVMKSSSPITARFMEVERHGRPIVIFDKDGLLAPVPLDRAAHEARVRAKLADLRDRVPLLAPLAIKAARRGNAPEAASMYHGIALRGLVDLLRIIHCPDRFDFGLRYIRADLPADAAELVERLALPGSPEQVAAFTKAAMSAFDERLPAADAAWGGRAGGGGGGTG
ncbi:MAG: nucleotidyltransferase domain-containing protein [Phycisphaeraceae bacterium]|nr:nucleotidyltransferase domain-containing protein [Phycisphaeraceae bacterium]